ncbi:MAG: aldo/keto reductase [Sphingobium sp.]
MIEKRALGNSGISIAPLMFGGNIFGWTVDKAKSFEILDAFVDRGFDAIDTADVYLQLAEGGVGTSERVIGEWVKARGNRDKVVIATKLGMPMANGKRGLSRGYMVEAVEASLQRLQTDYIDLYQAHSDDDRTPQEEVAETFDLLVKQGKVRAIGASNFSADRLRSALDVSAEKGVTAYATLQPLYNLFDRDDFEAELQPLCAERGVAVIPFFSLASGFLTGKYRSRDDMELSKRGAIVEKYLTDAGIDLLSVMDGIAVKHQASNAQIAIAWLLAQPTIAAPIASATGVAQLDQLAGALTIKLDADDLARLDAARVYKAPAPA